MHPLTIFILPLILSVYAIFLDQKRRKNQYRFTEIRYLAASHALGARPELKTFRKEAEDLIEEYKQLFEKKTRKQKDSY